MSDFVVYPNAILVKKADPRPIDVDMLRIGDALMIAAKEAQAYGLAASHLGHAEPIAIVSFATDPATRDYRLLYNPTIAGSSTDGVVGMEGSVSLPGIEVPVERAEWVDITYDNAAGERQTVRVDGFVARVAQHEIDQVNGIFFLSRVSRIKRETALRKFHKSQRT